MEKFGKEGWKYERGLLTLMLSMEISGKNMNKLLKESKNDLEDENVSVSASTQEMYKIIGEKAYKIVTKVLKENDKRIKKLSESEKAQAITDFKDLNILIQDRFRAKMIQQAYITSMKGMQTIMTKA